jgi:hypothetical protein
VRFFEDAEGNKFTQTCEADEHGSQITWEYTSKDEECVNKLAGRCHYYKAVNQWNIRGTSQSYTGSVWVSMNEQSDCFWIYIFHRDTCYVINKQYWSADGVPGGNAPDYPLDELPEDQVKDLWCDRPN